MVLLPPRAPLQGPPYQGPPYGAPEDPAEGLAVRLGSELAFVSKFRLDFWLGFRMDFWLLA